MGYGDANGLLFVSKAGGDEPFPPDPPSFMGVGLDEASDLLLPASTQAGRFGRARSQRSAALLEDYAELIADLLAAGGEARAADIARRLGVSHVTVVKAIARLKREGLATAKPYRGVFLTPAGEALATRVRTRHRLVVDLLLAVGVPPEDAENDAEGIEHHVSPRTLEAFARFLKPA